MRLGVVTAVLVALLAAAAPARAAAPASCGAPAPDRVITGEFTSAQTGSFVFLPFDVPRGTTAIRAWYCYDQPEGPTAQLPAYAIRHTLDFGLYQPKPRRQPLWAMKQYRGWSGSGFFNDITVSPEGYAEDPDPARKPAGKTSRGYRPGPIEPGTWAVELGVAAVVATTQGDLDGKVAWRVELQLEDNPAFADEPYHPAEYDKGPARRGPGWYAGDFHVHTDQSGDAKHRAPARAVFDYAFGEAGLDFVQATDHNTDGGWGEWGRYQRRYPGKLIARNEEITTYRGHVNSPGARALADYRTGPVYERTADGSLRPLRAARPVSEVFDQVHAAGGVTQINHPTIFDARVPPFAVICRGCSWEYTDAETDFAKVDSVEVETGPQGLKTDGTQPGPNPFTPLAIDFYEQALAAAGRPIAAVSGSDSHTGGESSLQDVTGTPVGAPMTMVHANDLSERSVASAVRAGHTYVRSFGHRSPRLRFDATAGDLPAAMMGDELWADAAEFTARVTGGGAGPEPLQLVVVKDGLPLLAVPVTSADFTYSFPSAGAGRYRLQVQRGTAIEALTTPIWLRPAAAAPAVALPRPSLASRRIGSAATCVARGAELRLCRVVVKRRGRVVARGERRMTAGRVRVPLRWTAKRGGRRTVVVTAVDALGRTRSAANRAAAGR